MLYKALKDTLYDSAWIQKESSTCEWLCEMRNKHCSNCLTQKDIQGTSICDTTIGGKLRDCPKCLYIFRDIEASHWASWDPTIDGLTSYSNMTISNMKPITLAETSRVSNSYQTEHGTYKVQRKRKEAFLSDRKAYMSPTVAMKAFINMPFGNWCTSPICICKCKETRPWERPNIWLRNGTHLELYSFEHEYSLPERNKGTRKTMNEKWKRALIQQWWVQYNHKWHEPHYEMKHNGAAIAPRIIEIGHMVLQRIP